MSLLEVVMRVLIIGGSGFIGRKLVIQAPSEIDITYSYYSKPIPDANVNSIKLNLMDNDLNWKDIIEGYDSIIICARPKGKNKSERDDVAIKTAKSFTAMIDAIQKSENNPFLLAIHGSLSYGDRNEDLVNTNSKISPIGFAQSYSIGEKPIRDYLKNSGNVAIIRAPWVLGNGSWYQSMYMASKKIPLLSKNPWMSIVYLDDLAQSAWEILLKSKPGVYHSKLTYRCKQNEFAKIITSITKKPYVKLGNIRLMFYEKQMRKSILSSIKLDDSRGSVSEEDFARQALIEKITKIHSDL